MHNAAVARSHPRESSSLHAVAPFPPPAAPCPPPSPPCARAVAFGYNHSISHRGRTYHVQTEDSGRAKGHVFTHLFYRGAIVASSKLEYADSVVDTELMDLLKQSHKSMLRRLVRGMYDDLLTRHFGARAPEPAVALAPVEAPSSDCGVPTPVPRKRHLSAVTSAPDSTPSEPSAAPDPIPSEPSDPSSSAASPRPPVRLSAVGSPAHSCIRTIKESLDMQNIQRVLTSLMANVNGALGAALVDYESGMCLGSTGTGINTEIAAAGNTEVMKAKTRVMRDLGIEGGIEDILITLESQYHIIRPVKSAFFLYLAFDRKQGNLAMARHQMAKAADEVEV